MLGHLLLARAIDRRPPRNVTCSATASALAEVERQIAAQQPPTASFPRLTHQSWKSAELPADFGRWRRSWRDCHPAYEHRLWTDADNARFVRERYPWLLPFFEELNHKIKR